MLVRSFNTYTPFFIIFFIETCELSLYFVVVVVVVVAFFVDVQNFDCIDDDDDDDFFISLFLFVSRLSPPLYVIQILILPNG